MRFFSQAFYEVMAWSPTRRYAMTAVLLIAITTFWWSYRLKPLITVLNHAKSIHLDSSFYEHDVQTLTANLEKLTGKPSPDFSPFAWVMQKATQVGLIVEKCGMLPEPAPSIEISVHGDFPTLLKFITQLNQSVHPLALEACSIIRQHDTLLEATFHITYDAPIDVIGEKGSIC